MIGWIACCVLVGFLLPLGAMLYLDILEAKHEVRAQTEKLETLRRSVERKNRDKDPVEFTDNPLFDRLRRPVPLPLPRSKELE